MEGDFSLGLDGMGADAASRVPLPEGSSQVFVMSKNLLAVQKEDMAWASYVLLRYTNTTSVKYFAKWGQYGTVDLKQKLDQLLMLISARCLLGKEAREKMFDEVFSAFHELTENGLQLTSFLFPYAPMPMTRRCDMVRARLSSIFAEIVQSRRSSNRVEEDVLQNLMDSKYKDGRPTTEAEVTGLIIALFFAGKNSSMM